MIDRAAYGQLNGALPKCNKCTDGYLYVQGEEIKCAGYLTAWMHCDFVCDKNDKQIKHDEWVFIYLFACLFVCLLVCLFDSVDGL